MIVNTALPIGLYEKLKYSNIKAYAEAFHSETIELDSKLSNVYKISVSAGTENFENENACQSEVRTLPVKNEVVLPTIENAVLEQENDSVENDNQFSEYFDSITSDILEQSEEESDELLYEDETEYEESSEMSEYAEVETQPVERIQEPVEDVQENENPWFIIDNVLVCQLVVTDLPQNENLTGEGIIDDEEFFDDEEEFEYIDTEEESDDFITKDETEEDSDNFVSDEGEEIVVRSLLIIDSLLEHQVTVNEETAEEVIENETSEDGYSEEDEEDITFVDEEEEDITFEEEEQDSEGEEYLEEDEEDITFVDEEENSFEDEDFIMSEEETVPIPVVPQATPVEQTDSLFNLQDSELDDDDELLFSDTTQQEEVDVTPKEVLNKKKKKAPIKAEVPLQPKVADTKEIRAFIKERGSVTIEELFKHFSKKSINKAELSGKIIKRNGKYKA